MAVSSAAKSQLHRYCVATNLAEGGRKYLNYPEAERDFGDLAKGDDLRVGHRFPFCGTVATQSIADFVGRPDGTTIQQSGNILVRSAAPRRGKENRQAG